MRSANTAEMQLSRFDHLNANPILRQQKITLAEMRAAGVRGPLIYCSLLALTAISGDRWPDNVND